MDFLALQNITRFRALLARETDAGKRETLRRLLELEEAKLRRAHVSDGGASRQQPL